MDIKEATPCALICGQLKAPELVTRFYDRMDADPDYFGIRELLPEAVGGSHEKLFMFMFLTGWFGGPQL